VTLKITFVSLFSLSVYFVFFLYGTIRYIYMRSKADMMASSV